MLFLLNDGLEDYCRRKVQFKKEVCQFAGKLMDEYRINKKVLHAYRK